MLAALAGFARGSGLEYHLGLYVDVELLLVLAVGIVASTPALPYLAGRLRYRRAALESAGRQHFDRLTAASEVALLMVVFLASLSWMAAGTYNPFLYFRF